MYDEIFFSAAEEVGDILYTIDRGVIFILRAL